MSIKDILLRLSTRDVQPALAKLPREVTTAFSQIQEDSHESIEIPAVSEIVKNPNIIKVKLVLNLLDPYNGALRQYYWLVIDRKSPGNPAIFMLDPSTYNISEAKFRFHPSELQLIHLTEDSLQSQTHLTRKLLELSPVERNKVISLHQIHRARQNLKAQDAKVVPIHKLHIYSLQPAAVTTGYHSSTSVFGEITSASFPGTK